MKRLTHLFLAATIVVAALASINITVEAADEVDTLSETSSSPAQEASVLCNPSGFLDVASFSQAGYTAPSLNVTCGGATMTVVSNGIPNHEFVPITPNDLQAQNWTWTIPVNPTLAAEPTDIPILGTIAFAVNGVPIFGPNEAPNMDYGDPYLDEILDFCNGHTAQRGMYHYHASPTCLFDHYETPGTVVGYSLDGFPILSPYVCADAACSSTYEVQSSWVRTQDVRNAWQAHEYIEGAGDLDQCNGMTLSDGSYAYFATSSFPYFQGCYSGTPNNDTFAGGGDVVAQANTEDGAQNAPAGGGTPNGQLPPRAERPQGPPPNGGRPPRN